MFSMGDGLLSFTFGKLTKSLGGGTDAPAALRLCWFSIEALWLNSDGKPGTPPARSRVFGCFCLIPSAYKVMLSFSKFLSVWFFLAFGWTFINYSRSILTCGEYLLSFSLSMICSSINFDLWYIFTEFFNCFLYSILIGDDCKWCWMIERTCSRDDGLGLLPMMVLLAPATPTEMLFAFFDCPSDALAFGKFL